MTAPLPGPSLFDRRFLVVSGKGGVGRTTLSAALAVAAAAKGRQVLIAQMNAHERLGALFGREVAVGPDVVSLAPRIDAVNMTARSALHEYGRMVLHYDTVVRAVLDNRAVRGFLGAVPGLESYAMLGKAWFHTTVREGRDARFRHDLVILDAPASGHVTTMLRIPRSILETMPRGPLSKDARAMSELFADPARAAFVLVTLPEELPAREAAELARAVRRDLQMPFGPLVVNAVPDATATTPAVTAVLAALPAGRATGDGALDATVAGMRALAVRRRDAEEVITRLGADPGLPIVTLPRFAKTRLGPAEVQLLADRLAGL